MASYALRRYAVAHARFVGGVTISGIVKVLTVPLAKCPVYLLEQDGFYPIRQTISGASGAYSFPNMEADKQYIVLALDPSGAYNAVVADRVQT